MSGADHTQFPPDSWWSPLIPPDTREAVASIFHDNRLDPGYLYSWEHKLGARASIFGNKSNYILSAIYQASRQRRRELDSQEDLSLEADNPMFGLASRRRQQGSVAETPFATALPAWRMNTAFGGTPGVEGRVQRSLSSAMDAIREGGRLSIGNDSAQEDLRQVLHDNPSNRVVPAQTNAQTITDSGSGAIAGQSLDPQADSHAERVAERQQWSDRLAARQHPAVQNAAAESTSVAIQGDPSRPLESAQLALAPINTQQMAGPQSDAQTRSQHVVTSEAVTPAGRRIIRTQSSPNLTIVDLGRVTDSQRRAINDRKLRFTSRTYLLTFIENVEKAFQKATHLSMEERAEALAGMLDEEVKERLADRAEVVNPVDPEQIFQVLRTEFPPRLAELTIALQTARMADEESAYKFISRCKQLFQSHQAPFPDRHSDMLRVYMGGTRSFITFCQERHESRLDHLHHDGHLDSDYAMGWSEFQNWARLYDSKISMNAQVRDARRSTRETKALAVNDTSLPKTRSGTVRGNVSAVDTDDERRGRSNRYRSESRHERSASRSKSAGYRSASSYGSEGERGRRTFEKRPFRNPSKSPGRYAGSTPRRGRDFQKTIPGKQDGKNDGPQVSMIQAVELNWINVNLLDTQRNLANLQEIDPRPIVISTLPAQVIRQNSACADVCAVGRRPNNPEPVAQEDLEDTEPLNLPEAMRRGLRQVQNLPVQNPYAKILNSNFYLTLRQLAGLCLDEQWQSICRQLLEVSLQREGRNQTAVSARVAADIFKIALADLPHNRIAPDRVSIRSPELPTQLCAAEVGQKLDVSIVRMTELQVYVDDQQRQQRTFKLDSGASVSCISAACFEHDKSHLLRHGKAHTLLTPMTLSGFASAHTRVSTIVESPQFVIGNAACRHTVLVVPGLVCDYMLGQDFMMAYDMQVDLREQQVSMGVPQDEWIGDKARFTGSQKVNARLGWSKALLAVKPK